MQFGNGLNNQPLNTLFFAAGPGGEAHGLYGRVDVPEPTAMLLATIAACVLTIGYVIPRGQTA